MILKVPVCNVYLQQFWFCLELCLEMFCSPVALDSYQWFFGYPWYHIPNISAVEMRVFGFVENITERKQMELEREKLITELQEALKEIKELRGFLPICANCKNIRDDGGYWQQVEQYIMDRTDAQFSHSICPECTKKLYPNLDLKP